MTIQWGKHEVPKDFSLLSHIDLSQERVVIFFIYFLDVLQNQEQKEYRLCYDNFFTSVKLVPALKEKSIKATATIRESKTKECPLVRSNNMKSNQEDRLITRLILKME